MTCVIPLGVGLGAVLGAFMGSDQWRLLFAIGVLPSRRKVLEVVRAVLSEKA